MHDLDQVNKIAEEYGESEQCDVFLYNGPILRGYDNAFIQTCRNRNKRPNILLVLTTSGGDAHAAYRIARALQQMYKEIRVFVPGWCKSAGTLIAIAGNRLVIGDLGELGPVDVQRLKDDDLLESSSGLTEDAAIITLESASWRIFERFVLEIKKLSGGQVTFKTAAEVAVPLVTGILSPVFAQIDPLKIGENSRAMKIASDYGKRLDVYSKNLKSEQSIDNLVSGYSSHGFVIDRKEAEEILNNVKEPDDNLEKLCNALGHGAFVPLSEKEPKWFHFVNPEIKDKPKQQAEGNIHEKTERNPRKESSGVNKKRRKTEPSGDTSTAVETTALSTDSNG